MCQLSCALVGRGTRTDRAQERISLVGCNEAFVTHTRLRARVHAYTGRHARTQEGFHRLAWRVATIQQCCNLVRTRKPFPRLVAILDTSRARCEHRGARVVVCPSFPGNSPSTGKIDREVCQSEIRRSIANVDTYKESLHVGAVGRRSSSVCPECEYYRRGCRTWRAADARYSAENTAVCKVTSCRRGIFSFPFPSLPACRETIRTHRGTRHVYRDRHYEQDARNKLLHRVLCT